MDLLLPRVSKVMQPLPLRERERERAYICVYACLQCVFICLHVCVCMRSCVLVGMSNTNNFSFYHTQIETSLRYRLSAWNSASQ